MTKVEPNVQQKRIQANCASRLVALAFAFFAASVLPAQASPIAVVPSQEVTPQVNQVTVNNAAGHQFDPHVSGDFTSYTNSATGTSRIHYFDFVTNADPAIPNALPSGETGSDFLSDISGNIIVFTRLTSGKSAIYAFLIPKAWLIELDPQAGSNRRGAAIGGNTVAWVDFGFGGPSEIVVYDLVSNATERLTYDAVFDSDPAVSPDGNVVVWAKCATSAAPCDIYQAVKSAPGWTVSQVTSTADPEFLPDTNGSVVVYGAVRAGSATGPDIYWRSVTGGPEYQLALPGVQRNPNISGDLISFESIAPGEFPADLYVYDLSTKILHRLTDTPALDETLNDISVLPDGTVRVVWSVPEQDFNVYALTFMPERGSLMIRSGTDWRAIGPEGNTERCCGINNVPLASVGLGWEAANPGWNDSLTFDDSAWTYAVINQPGALGPDPVMWVDGNGENGSTPAYFRRVFNIPGVPTSGRLTLGVDDDAQIYINGYLAVDDQDGGATLFSGVDVTSLLGSGDNLIAIKAHDSFGWKEGIGLRLTVDYRPLDLQYLISLIRSFNLQRGIENSLVVKLERAEAAESRGDLTAACNLLDAFINEVNAQSGKALTTAQADQLIKAASQIKVGLGCP